jgi:DNA-binding XRE family transcriptional regulator
MKNNSNHKDDALKHLEELKAKNPKIWRDYDIGLQAFKIAVLLKQLREESGLNQEQLANRLHITKQAVSKFENHCEDIRLSTLQKVANATGHSIALNVRVKPIGKSGANWPPNPV